MPEEKKGPGAPLGNQNNKKENPKNEIIKFRVTKEQKDSYQERAERENLSLSKWIVKKLK